MRAFGPLGLAAVLALTACSGCMQPECRTRRQPCLAAVLALTACSGGSPERTVTLTVHHSQFSLGELRVRPGETVRFVLRNTDPIPHELIVGEQSVQDAHEVGTEGHHGDRPGEVSVAPGASAVTTYRFGPEGGRLLFGCHLPGHWAYGMKGIIRVG